MCQYLHSWKPTELIFISQHQKLRKLRKKNCFYWCILTHGLFNLEVLFKNYFVLAGEPVMEMWNQKRHTHIHVIILFIKNSLIRVRLESITSKGVKILVRKWKQIEESLLARYCPKRENFCSVNYCINPTHSSSALRLPKATACLLHRGSSHSLL